MQCEDRVKSLKFKLKFNYVVLLILLLGQISSFTFAFQNALASSQGKTVVIPLKGTVGNLFSIDPMSKTGWFDSLMIKELLEKAKKDKDNVTRIIFEIDSTGGYVYEMRRICDLIQSYRSDFEFVAYAHDALSAASWIALTCDRLLVSSDSKIGACVTLNYKGVAVFQDGGVVDSANEKFKSANASEYRTWLANGRKPVEIAGAFAFVEIELWFNEEEKRFSNEQPELDKENPEFEDGWILLDGDKTILTFDSLQLLKYGLAEDRIDSLKTHYQKDKFENWSNELSRLRLRVSKKAAELDEDIDDLREYLFEILNVQIPLKSAYQVQNKSEYGRLYKIFRKRTAKAVIHARQIVKNYERKKYPFEILSRTINQVKKVDTLGQKILDDKKYDCENIFRHYDEMIEAWDWYVLDE